MTNIDTLMQHENHNVRIFADTINKLHNSTGFYSSIYADINSRDIGELDALIQEISKQDFTDDVDVVIWLEEC